MDLNTLTSAITSTNKNKQAYILQHNKSGLYVSYSATLIKTKSSALRMTTNNLDQWAKMLPYNENINDFKIVKINSKK